MKIIDRFAAVLARHLAPLVAATIAKQAPPRTRSYGECPTTAAAVHTLYVTEGTRLTLFLGAHRKTDADPPYHQVELRVREDGTPEIYSDLATTPFADWEGTP